MSILSEHNHIYRTMNRLHNDRLKQNVEGNNRNNTIQKKYLTRYREKQNCMDNLIVYFKFEDVQIRNLREQKLVDNLQNILSETFSDFLAARRKPKTKQLYALTVISYNILRIIKSDAERFRSAPWEINSDELSQEEYVKSMIKRTYVFRHHGDNSSKKHDHSLGEVSISNSVFNSVISYLVENGLMYKKSGHYFPEEKDSKNSIFEVGLVVPQWDKWIAFMNNVNDDLLKDVFIDDDQNEVVPEVEFRRRVNGEKLIIPEQKIQITHPDLNIIQFSKDVVQMFRDSYSKMDVSLLKFQDAPEKVQFLVETELIEKYGRENINFDSLNLNISIMRNYIRSASYGNKRRILYNDSYGSLTFGRMFGHWIDRMPREYKPLITIDGQVTCDIDIKSAYPQLFYLTRVHDQPIPDDLYGVSVEYKTKSGDKRILPRDHVKLIVQLAMNNDSVEATRKAYANPVNKPLFRTYDQMNCAINQILSKFPEYQRLFFSRLEPQLTYYESKLMLKVCSCLMYSGIHVIYNFDGIRVKESDVDQALKVITETSKQQFVGKAIRVSVKPEMYNTRDLREIVKRAGQSSKVA